MTPPEQYELADILSSAHVREQVSARINQGQVCVYPTDTIYGIGGRGDSDDVRRRVRQAKRRPAQMPILLVAARRRAFDSLGLRFPPEAEKLAAHFWPGKLTLVVPGTDGGPAVGVRLSDHPFLHALRDTIDAALLSTSANMTGEVYDGTPGVLWRLFRGRVDFMVDGGVLPPSPPSTVVRVGADGAVELLREGAVAGQAIADALGREV
jgi:L-threonylcarbamoyladenylate synthase